MYKTNGGINKKRERVNEMKILYNYFKLKTFSKLSALLFCFRSVEHIT